MDPRWHSTDADFVLSNLEQHDGGEAMTCMCTHCQDPLSLWWPVADILCPRYSKHYEKPSASSCLGPDQKGEADKIKGKSETIDGGSDKREGANETADGGSLKIEGAIETTDGGSLKIEGENETADGACGCKFSVIVVCITLLLASLAALV